MQRVVRGCSTVEAAVASAAAGLSVEAWCGRQEIKQFCVFV